MSGDYLGAVEQCSELISIQRQVCCLVTWLPAHVTLSVCGACAPQIYHPNHPLIALQQYTLGDLLRNLEEVGGVEGLDRVAGGVTWKAVLAEACKSLEVAYGRRHPFVADLRSLIVE